MKARFFIILGLVLFFGLVSCRQNQDSGIYGNWKATFLAPKCIQPLILAERDLYIKILSKAIPCSLHLGQNTFSFQPPKNLAEVPGGNPEDWVFLQGEFEYAPDRLFTSIRNSLRLGTLGDKAWIWINGHLIDQPKSLESKSPEGYDRIRIYPLDSSYLEIEKYKNSSQKGIQENLESPNDLEDFNTGKKILIGILVKRFFSYELGLLLEAPLIKEERLLHNSFYKSELLGILPLSLYLGFGLYFLFLFIRRRQETEYLFFALFIINLVLYQFLKTQWKFLWDLDFEMLKRLEYLLLPTFIPLKAEFIHRFCKHKRSIFLSILHLGSATLLVLMIFAESIISMDFINRNFLQPIWLLYVMHTLKNLVMDLRSKKSESLFILLGLIGIVAVAIIDILAARYLWNIPKLAGIRFSVNILLQCILLADRFIRLNFMVEDLNKNLERKVENRTAQLKESLSEIQKLKEKQDGDYFLNSLLLRALEKKFQESHLITSKILTEQNKVFQFRGKEYRIGGDYSITSMIQLRKEEYLLFVNSDSMGKSIQGAGGALVLGSMLESILSRTKSSLIQQKYPEKWLHSAFLDLQSAFQSFEGSMLVSLIMGLVHLKSGYLYYFNSEHPEVIRYHKSDKTADFLQNKSHSRYLRKIGISENESDFSIQTYQMRHGEILILGTDGRDDIQLGIDRETRKRVINEDENKILRITEKAEGELDRILQVLKTEGDLTDDISLVSLEISSDLEKERRKRKPEYQYFTRIWKEAYRNQNYSQAISALEHCISWNPGDENLILIQAVCFEKLKDWDSARSAWERLILREPDDSKIQDRISRLNQKLVHYQNLEKTPSMDPPQTIPEYKTEIPDKEKRGNEAKISDPNPYHIKAA
jgi:tetratricopeptide (TPR) repeat protein